MNTAIYPAELLGERVIAWQDRQLQLRAWDSKQMRVNLKHVGTACAAALRCAPAPTRGKKQLERSVSLKGS